MADGTVLVSGFSYLLLSQVASRGVTFLLNLIVTRLLSPEAYGLAAVQFHLINTIILFLSREGFRRGCLRTPVDGQWKVETARRTLANAVLCIPAGCLVTLITCRVALGWHDADASHSPQIHRQAIWLQGAAAMLELLSEPLYVLAAVQLRFRLRALVDTAAIVAKSAATVALLQLTAMPAALALSWAQNAFAAVTLACYGAAYARDVPSWLSLEEASEADSEEMQEADSCKATHPTDLPDAATTGSDRSAVRQRKSKKKETEASTAAPHPDASANGSTQGGLLHGPTLWLCGSFSLQAAEKLVLAEGSKMVMVSLQSARSQGVYGLVVNLGSLVVRTVFQPFEEAAFTSFSTSGGDKWQSARLLAALVRSVAIVGLLSAAFGPAYSWLLLHLLYGARWSATAAPTALSAYSSYILLLAVNGILEAYVHASANSRQLVHINVGLVAFAGAHMALSGFLVRLGGASGLIAADSINMLLRIAFSLAYVRILSAGHARLTAFLPSRGSLAALSAASVITGCSGAVTVGPIAGGPIARMLALLHGSGGAASPMAGTAFQIRVAAHIGVGAACLASVLLAVRRCEGRLWSELAALRRGSGPAAGSASHAGKAV